ncbi:ArgS-related anticodon-binding protein NrtL [Streptomyces sp. NPDC088115]|uniref:ArgS-related anticodon-binding protein NrtL n=1 Tax=Streptomyces sp. NPDC088115 TaxID=3365824 RepID=UPI003826E08F
MTPADLSSTVLHAVRRAVAEDALRAPVPARVRVERTRPGGRGDYASAVALQLAGPAALPAREVAEILRARMAGAPGIGRVEITGPGFLNFTLDAATDAAALVHQVLERGTRYGHGDALAGVPLRFGHAREVRAAVTADAVRRLVLAQGGLVRISCHGERDPDWTRLGIAADAHGQPPVPSAVLAQGQPPVPPTELAHGQPPVPPTEIRPVPAGATAGELLARLGPDATRWGLLRPAGHDRAPLGDELLVQAEGNPLFLVRYAHSRARALSRGAELLGFTGGGGQGAGAAAFEAPEALALLAVIADHPAVLAAAARHRAPDRLARHLEAVAHAFFDFHDATSPLPAGDEKPSAAHRARLALAEAAGTVLAGGLSLLGVSAPPYL